MSGTPNLGIAHIASNQASKEVTANAAFDQLDQALTNQLSHVMSDADYALADSPPVSSEARYNMVFVFTGALTQDRSIILPAGVEKLYIVSNQTTGGHNLIFEVREPSSPFIPGEVVGIPNLGSVSPFVPSDYWILYCDGTDVIPLTALSPDEAIWVAAPAHNTSNGIAGQLAYDGSYLYVCTATNFWARVAIGGSW
jgi:hypothetical protein